MPSPFPGMDPYLEHPEFFPDLHSSLIAEIKNALQPQLPAPYFSMITSRIWVEYSQRTIEPDVVVYVANDEIHENFVEIYTVQGDRRLVTAIEVLSLSNKTPGAHGRSLYEQKQRELLSSQVHLVEIDLLRGGSHTTAVPRERALAEAGPFDYHICLHRFDNLKNYFVYPVYLEQPLPEIAIPLLPGDPIVRVDLQSIFNRCYDNGPYRHISPYPERTPVPPLRLDKAEWSNRLLREKGLLPPA